MSLEADKKRQYTTLADRAMDESNHRKAAFNMAKAAEFALKLADKCDGKVRRAHIREARDFVDIAEKLHETAPPPSRKEHRKLAKDEPAGGEGDTNWLITEKPQVRLSDIAGMDEVKAKLAEMIIQPMRHPEKAREWGIRAGGGILLFGPPGNGKTTLGRAVAAELDAAFFYATGAQIRSKWHGESEQHLRKLVLAARSRPLSVLFLDDVDALLPRRGGNSVVDNRIVAQFLAEVGGFTDSPNVLLLLGATNKPWDIDEAVFRTGRFDEKIFVGLPDAAARTFMIRKALGTAPMEAGIESAALAVKLEGYTGSDIGAIVQSAKRTGFRRSLEGGSNLLALADIEGAMKTIPSSATGEMMRDYEKFARARFK